jgi:nicotinamide mononucleotide (NMN) deamidase PncC
MSRAEVNLSGESSRWSTARGLPSVKLNGIREASQWREKAAVVYSDAAKCKKHSNS